MATFNKFNSFVEALAEGTHNLGTDTLQVALHTNANAPVAGDTRLADLTEIGYDNCSARTLTTSASSQTGGTYKLVINDLVLTASGGSVGPFQWVTVFNQTAGADELVAFFDYGSEITLADGEQITLDFDPTNGLLDLV